MELTIFIFASLVLFLRVVTNLDYSEIGSTETKIITILLALLLTPLFVLLGSWLLQFSWSIFIVPPFGALALTWAQSLGIYGMLCAYYPVSKNK